MEETLQQQNLVVAITAHELRNPLSAIELSAHVLNKQQSTSEQRTQATRHILERTKHLQGLVNKYLAAASIDAQNVHAAPRPVAILALLLERLAEFGQRAEDVHVECSPELVAFADRSELSEMIANYLENAFLYGRPPVHIEATKQADQVEILVSDRGSGVPHRFLPHLFEHFGRAQQSQRTTAGTGLGLWLVRSLARANHGDAWYEPNPGGGACFYLRIPAATRDDTASQNLED